MACAVLALPAAAEAREVAVSLSGSRASMERQNRIAREQQYSFLRTPVQVQSFVDEGRLIDVPGNADYDVIAGYPFARPVVRAFVERLASRYHEACGEKLVVTSLTRPAAKQPGNASPLSVHPAGMAVDLRVSRDAGCVEWLEAELLDLEDMGLLDATREYRPPHFHIAVFPAPFSAYDRALAEAEAAAQAEAEAQRALAAAEQARTDSVAAAQTAVAQASVQGRAPTLLVFVAAFFTKLLVPFYV